MVSELFRVKSVTSSLLDGVLTKIDMVEMVSV